MDFPAGSQSKPSHRFVADQLVWPFLGHSDRPVRSNAEGTLHCPSGICGIDLLNGDDVPQETGQILKIPIEPENLVYCAVDDHTRFDRARVPRRQ